MQIISLKNKKIIYFVLFELLLLIIFNVFNSNINLVKYNFRFLLFIIGFNILIITRINRKLLFGFIVIEICLSYYLIQLYYENLKYYSNPMYVCLIIALIFVIFGLQDIINEKLKLVKLIKKMTFYDNVTNLPNKNLISKSCPIKKAIKCQDKKCIFNEYDYRYSHNKYAVLLIDIDDFKLINDSLGYENGNILLKQVANRLKNLLRQNDKVVYLSEDLFLIIMHDIYNKNVVDKVTHKILTSIRQPFLLSNRQIYITTSIGIAMYPKHGNCLNHIINKADIALNTVKNEGKNKHLIFNDDLESLFNNRYEKIFDLKSAIKNEEFIVHYQPKAYVKTNEIFGLEALVRWNHPKLGLIYPNDFIPLSEEIGIIQEIDLLVLRIACKQIKQWLEDGKNPLNITVNVSPLFFMEVDFIEKIDHIISEIGINPSYIGIEITETIFIKDIEATKRKIEELKKRKIKVYLDDFGKGYSSLSYLKNFPIDFLKIDKNFIDGIKINHIDEGIITCIINICSLLGIKVISEGIETEQQLEFVRENGCNIYQGYLLSKPKTIEKLKL